MAEEPESTSSVCKLPSRALAELKRSHSKGRSVLKRAKSKKLEKEKASKMHRCKSSFALDINKPLPGNSEEPRHETKRKAPAEDDTLPAPAKRTAAKSKIEKPEEASTLKPKSRKGKKAEVKPNTPSQDVPSGSTEVSGENKEKEKQHQRKEAQETNEVFHFEKTWF